MICQVLKKCLWAPAWERKEEMKEILLLFFTDGASEMFLGSRSGWFWFVLLRFCSRVGEFLWVTKPRCSCCFLWCFNEVPPPGAGLEISQKVWSGIRLWFASCAGANWTWLFFKGEKTPTNPRNCQCVFLLAHRSDWGTQHDATTLMQDVFCHFRMQKHLLCLRTTQLLLIHLSSPLCWILLVLFTPAAEPFLLGILKWQYQTDKTSLGVMVGSHGFVLQIRPFC